MYKQLNDNDTETKTEGINKDELEELHRVTVKGHWYQAESNIEKE